MRYWHINNQTNKGQLGSETGDNTAETIENLQEIQMKSLGN